MSQLVKALLRKGNRLESLPQNPRINDFLAEGIGHEAIVLFPTGDQLRENKVVFLQAESSRLASVFIANRDQPPFPACRQCRGLGADTMGVIAMGVVEHASLAENPVDLVDLITTMERVDIGLG